MSPASPATCTRGDAIVTSDPAARDRLVLALDVGDLAAAEAMAARVGEWFGIAKVGLELFMEAGPAAFARFHDLG